MRSKRWDWTYARRSRSAQTEASSWAVSEGLRRSQHSHTSQGRAAVQSLRLRRHLGALGTDRVANLALTFAAYRHQCPHGSSSRQIPAATPDQKNRRSQALDQQIIFSSSRVVLT